MKRYLFLFILLYPLFIIAQIDTIQFEAILIDDTKVDNLQQKSIGNSSIFFESPRDVGEIFKREDGFGLVKRGNYAMEPVLRGFKYEQLNVKINGGTSSANACPNRMDPIVSQVSPEDIEKIEIIRGPYSVRYGSNLGGTINMVTRRPQSTEKLKVSGSLNGGYQSNGSNQFLNGHIMLTDKYFDLIVSGNHKDYGNYLSGDGDTINASFKRNAYAIKLGINPGKNHRIQLNWQQGFAKDVMHPGLPMDAKYDNSSIVSLDYNISQITASFFSLKTKVYHSYVDHLMTNEGRMNYNFVHSSTPVTAQLYGGRSEAGFKLSDHNILYVGVDYRQINKDGLRNREVLDNPCDTIDFEEPKIFTDKVWQNSLKQNAGFFIEEKYQLNHRLLWVSGIRLDYVSYTISDPAEDFAYFYDGQLNPEDRINLSINTTLNYEVSKQLKLQWSIGRGTRAPELSELFINHFTVGMDAHEYLGNPQLKSEINYQSDLAIEKDFNQGRIYGSVFYSMIRNYIAAKLDSSIQKKYLPCKDPKFTKVFTNVDDVRLYGFEAGFDISFLKYLKFMGGISYTYAENVSWKEPLAEIPPLMMNTALNYTKDKLTANVKARIHSSQNRVADSFNETSTPGFYVMDFYLSYHPLKYVEVYASVLNIFDEQYVEHLSRSYRNAMANEIPPDGLYYEPGRSFNAGLKLRF